MDPGVRELDIPYGLKILKIEYFPCDPALGT